MATHPNKSKASPTHPTPKTLPATGFVRLADLFGFIPLSKNTIWRKVKDKSFPQPVKLGPMTTAWRVEDVKAWIDSFSKDQKEAA